ncbi:MAG: TrkH family potassium uptake protein [Thermodesulfobacteriota bacterium]|jgi:trk system potassium uptake protein TrkH
MNLAKSFYLTSIFIRYYSYFLLVPILSIFFIDPTLGSMNQYKILIQAYPFILSSLLTFFCSVIVKRFSYNESIQNDELGRKDGFLIASVVWIFAGIFGALPYIFSSLLLPFQDSINLVPIFENNIIINSFFESVSGITTTGASVFTNFPSLEHHSMLIFWRSLTQWLGGIGIILLVLIIFPRISVGIMQIASDQEGTGPQKERITPRLYQTGITLLIIYAVITLILFLLLFFIGDLNSFDSIVHSFSTVSSGGFSSYPLSIETLNNFSVEMIILCFMFLSGISFAIFYFVITWNFQKIWENSEFKTFVLFNILLVLSLVLILQNQYNFETALDSFRYGSFQALSISTGTGFTTYNFDQWPSHAKILLLIFLVIGGSSGSTTGGIKIVRILIVVKRVYQEIRRRISPNVVYTVKINNKSLDDEVVTGVLSFLFLFVFICAISILLIIILEPNITSLSAASAVLSSIANVGPGFEQVNAHSNYSIFSTPTKLLLTFLMMLGRLEIFTMIALFLPSFWKKY